MSETMATKTVEQTIEIEASPDEVWQAISTAEEGGRLQPRCLVVALRRRGAPSR